MSNAGRIYLDHASYVPMYPEAQAAMLPWLSGAWNPNAVHAAGRQARGLIDAVRADLAKLWSVPARNIIFCASGSESIATALIGYAGANAACKTIITSRAEHAAVLDTVARLTDTGYEVIHLPTDCGAHPDLAGLASALQARPPGSVLISCMYVNNEFGTITDIAKIAQLARAHGAALHCDAIGAGETIAVDPAIVVCDAISLAAQKCGGPAGAGILIARDHFQLRGLIPGGPQEYGRRAGTENCAAIAGAGRAFRLTAERQTATAARCAVMQLRFETQLRAAFPVAELLIAGGTPRPRASALSHLAFADVDGAALLANLDLAGIALSAGSACAAGAVGRSHVVDAAGLPATYTGLLRCSWGAVTGEADLDSACRAIERAVRLAREVEIDLR